MIILKNERTEKSDAKWRVLSHLRPSTTPRRIRAGTGASARTPTSLAPRRRRAPWQRRALGWHLVAAAGVVVGHHRRAPHVGTGRGRVRPSGDGVVHSDPSLPDFQSWALLSGFNGVLQALEVDEAETPRVPESALSDQLDFLDGAILGKCTLQFIFSRVERQAEYSEAATRLRAVGRRATIASAPTSVCVSNRRHRWLLTATAMVTTTPRPRAITVPWWWIHFLRTVWF